MGKEFSEAFCGLWLWCQQHCDAVMWAHAIFQAWRRRHKRRAVQSQVGLAQLAERGLTSGNCPIPPKPQKLYPVEMKACREAARYRRRGEKVRSIS